MRNAFVAAAFSFTLLASCEDVRLLNTVPETTMLEPLRIQVARHITEDGPDFCPFLSRGGRLPQLYDAWRAALPDADKNEIFVGRTDWMIDGDLCDYWIHNIYQGIMLFNLSDLPDGPVTSARMTFERTPLSDPSYPARPCFFEVGALTAPPNWRSRPVTRPDLPTLFSTSDENDETLGRHFVNVGASEGSVDVTRVVTSWEQGVYPNLGILVSPIEDDGPEDRASCGWRLENMRLEVTIARPIDS